MNDYERVATVIRYLDAGAAALHLTRRRSIERDAEVSPDTVW